MSNLLPGPSSTELAIFIGYRLCGFPGLIIAGVCFILPAFLIVWGLAAAYVRYGHLPAVSGILYLLKPIVLAIVIQALWRLGKSTIKNKSAAFIGVVAIGLCIAGVNPIFVMLAAAFLSTAMFWGRKKVPFKPAASVASPIMIHSIFLVFLKFGCVIFGSGYVLLAFLRSDLVAQRGWLTDQQLLDAVTVGQITPGPVFTTATFIGYLLGGSRGAIAATAGIFAPAFILVALTGPFIRKLRQMKWTAPLLDGLNIAAVALMAFVSWQLGRTAVVDRLTIGLMLGSAIVLVRLEVIRNRKPADAPPG
jgi:chromate transporter